MKKAIILSAIGLVVAAGIVYRRLSRPETF